MALFRDRGHVRSNDDGTEAQTLHEALRECRSALWRLVLVGSCVNVLALTPPLFAMQLYDRALSSGRVETLVMLTVLALFALAMMGLFEAVREMMLARVNRWLDRRLTGDLISSSVRASLRGLPPSAQALQDLTTIRTVLSGPGVQALADLPWAPVFIIVISFIHPLLGLVAVLAVAAALTILAIAETTSRRALREASRRITQNMARAETAVRNADVFEAMGLLPTFLKQWNERNEPALRDQLRAADGNAALHGLSRFLRMGAQIAVLALGAYLVVGNELSGGGMMAASMLLSRALIPVEQVIGAWRQFVAARDSYDRLYAIMRLVPRRPAAMPLPRPAGEVSCEGLTYYTGGRKDPLLDNIRFKLPAGEILGVIGPSASGKSTLCRAIVGILPPTRGRVRLDGQDVFAWPSDQVGRFIGYLPQEVELFEGSVRTNIGRLNPEADPAKVVEAARSAGVHEMILRLPEGYDTEVGAGGAMLSGGQRQRIGLARALFDRPPLIVLDEPNASLDAEGELQLIRAMQIAKAWGSTVIIVAHQPHIVKPADKLLVLRNGRVDLYGDRDEVLATLRPIQPQRPRPTSAPVPAQAGQGGRAAVGALPGAPHIQPTPLS
ncbi:type I secretion system permease/ATPase [Alsobacter soli]|uniref:Type I secretion system permease/ATPase n=1 Tax=Alsobacter soli TaxID=2109933 RepID=A0A2T1HQR9_9HYPH|nr:type I secretion system permease/ATPase [Alsobacter soli]PSC04004.1 type I secretion system permease/ATPase [Alsobacter soli]